MTFRKASPTGILFVTLLYVLAIICYVVFRGPFFAFCFGLAAIIATVSRLTGQRLG
jgi:hypothetical protein